MKRSMSGKDWFLAGFTTLVGAGKIDDGFREHKGTGTAVLGVLMFVAGIGWLISGYQEWRSAAKDRANASASEIPLDRCDKPR